MLPAHSRPTSPTAPGARRFQAADAIRGVAALAVVFYHLRLLLVEASSEAMPRLLESLFARGSLGVDVFFVLSGFVIAYSTHNGRHTWGYLGRFALRRAIRLDPPYWTTIALEIGLVYLGLYVLPSLLTPLPTSQQMVAHLFYAQNILGYGDILPIFWTLCYEIQFYVFLVFLLIVWGKLEAPARLRVGLAVFVLGTLFVVSLLLRFGLVQAPIPGSIALRRWFQFFLGVLVCWNVTGRISMGWLVAASAAIVATIVSGHAAATQLAAVLASFVILVTARNPALDALFGGRVLQYFGRISYSIYLIHLPIGWRACRAFYMAFGGQVSPLVGWAGFALGIAATIVGAAALHRLLEAPAMRLSKRISLPRGDAAAQQESISVVTQRASAIA